MEEEGREWLRGRRMKRKATLQIQFRAVHVRSKLVIDAHVAIFIKSQVPSVKSNEIDALPAV